MSLAHFRITAAEFISGIQPNHQTGLFHLRLPDNSTHNFDRKEIPYFVQAMTETRQEIASFLDNHSHRFPMVKDYYTLVGIQDGRFVYPQPDQTYHKIKLPSVNGNRRVLTGPFSYMREMDGISTRIFHPFAHNVNIGRLLLRFTEQKDELTYENEITGGPMGDNQDPDYQSNQYKITVTDLSLSSLMTFLGAHPGNSLALQVLLQASSTVFDLQGIQNYQTATLRQTGSVESYTELTTQEPTFPITWQALHDQLTLAIYRAGIRNSISLVKQSNDTDTITLIIRLNIIPPGSTQGHVMPLTQPFQDWLQAATESASTRRQAA